MRTILFSSTATVEEFQGKYYNNALKDTLPRYTGLGDRLICFAFCKKVSSKPATEEIVDQRVDLVFLDKVNTIKSLFVAKKENRKIIDSYMNQADACIIHVPSIIGELTVESAKAHHKPYLLVVVGCAWDGYWNYNFKGKLMAPFRYLSTRRVIKDSKQSIYVTNRFLQRRYPTSGKSIPCSNVKLDKLDEAVLAQRLERIKSRKEYPLKITTIATVDVRYKGQEYVIKALALLKKKNLQFEYHLVGGGKPDFLRNLAQKYGVGDQVFFHGGIAHHAVPGFLDEMDLYIQPSRQEGLPRALIEAMSRACPSLGSETAGIPELLDETCIFKNGAVKQIARLIEGMNTSCMLKMAERNFREAESYENSKLNKRRSDFLQEFIASTMH